jgi:hypothetical protein
MVSTAILIPSCFCFFFSTPLSSKRDLFFIGPGEAIAGNDQIDHVALTL